MCDHLQRVLTLAHAGQLITLSTAGPPNGVNSLLNNPEFWRVASVQHASGELYNYAAGEYCSMWLRICNSVVIVKSPCAKIRS